MKIWNVGLVGCGAISNVHLGVLSQMPNVKLVAVCDIDEAKLKAATEKYGCKGFTDYHDLIAMDEIEVVHVTTPHYLHAPIAIEAMKAGKKVITEKPVASEIADAAEMVEVAKTSQLAVCFQNRYNKSSQMMRQIVDSKEYGDIIGMRGIVTWHRDAYPYYTGSGWRGTWEKEGGGILINQSIHTLDLLLWLGGDVKSVKGAVSTDKLFNDIEVEDSAHFLVKFNNGITATFYATNAYAIDAPIFVEVVLEKATLRLRGDSLFILKDGEETMLCEPPKIEIGVNGKGYWGAGHPALIEDAYKHFESGEHFWIDGQVGFNALKVLKSVYQSSKENKEIVF
ncbi:MAG: Gfo/Idh/MocA family oxidoreductase [Clostridia bacterium]|nr:Gfo/Idh/MocA family oxidoreductase [Clostridia bacterium]